ncbi:hypothetical protein [Streptomyces sp. NBC_01477]|uniref:hypothetical protein n=1 Tax=Streptomyces sp. NBC_01477 TaxID=2976015 RepID=UPI002E337B76|nr:hypothetical protein [Streptomyces sp. NBC_01477]
MSGLTRQQILDHITGKVLSLPADTLGTSFAELWDCLSGTDTVTATGVETSLDDRTLTVSGTVALPGQDPVQARFLFTGDPVTALTLRLPRPGWAYWDTERSYDLAAVREALYPKGGAAPPTPTAVVTAPLGGTYTSRVELPLAAPGGAPFVLLLSQDEQDDQRLVLASPPGQAVSLSTLGELTGLPRLKDCEFTVPTEIPLNGLRLGALRFVVDARRSRLESVQIRVLAPDWEISKDVSVLALKDVGIGFTVALPPAPAVPAVSASLGATIALGDAEVTVSVTLPQLDLSFTGYLPDASMSKALPTKAQQEWNGTGLSLEEPGISVYGTANLRRRSWTLGCRWAGSLDAGTTRLDGLSVEASDQGAGLTVTAGARATIAGARCAVTLVKAGGWEFQGTVSDADVSAVLAWIGVPVPARITLDAVSVLYGFGSRDFTAMCDASLTFQDVTLELDVVAQKTAKGTALNAGLLVDDSSSPDVFPLLFTGSYAAGGKDVEAELGWKNANPLQVTRLARYFGVSLPDEFPKTLLPDIKEAKFTYSSVQGASNLALGFYFAYVSGGLVVMKQ